MNTTLRLLRLTGVITPRSQTGPPDQMGTPTWTDGDPVETKCWYQPLRGEELAARPEARATHRVWFPPGTAVDAMWRFAIPGVIAGEFETPGLVRTHPRTGQTNHVEAELIEYVPVASDESGS